MYKKASVFGKLVTVILLLMALVIILFFINNLTAKSNEQASDAVCAASIKQHIAFTDANLVAEKQIDKRTAGIGSLFIDPSADVPPIKCDTKLVESDANNAEEAEKELLSAAVKTWKLFNKGQSMLYTKDMMNTQDDMHKKPFCFVRTVHEFDGDLIIDLKKATNTYPVKDYIKNYKTDDFKKYLAENPNKSPDFWTYMEHMSDKKNILSYVIASFHRNLFYYTQLYYLGDVATKIHAKDFADVGFGAVDIERYMQDYSNDFGNFDRNILDNVFIYDGKKRYAVVFQQFHYSPSGSAIFGDKITRFIRSKIGKGAYPFVFSSIIILPYTSEAVQQIDCEYMPVEFED